MVTELPSSNPSIQVVNFFYLSWWNLWGKRRFGGDYIRRRIIWCSRRPNLLQSPRATLRPIIRRPRNVDQLSDLSNLPDKLRKMRERFGLSQAKMALAL